MTTEPTRDTTAAERAGTVFGYVVSILLILGVIAAIVGLVIYFGHRGEDWRREHSAPAHTGSVPVVVVYAPGR
jgi:hypothetical protein